jgi:hypothetical protein
MKTKLVIPTMIALVAVVALALPSVMAESSSEDKPWKYGDKHHKMHKIIQVGEYDTANSLIITEYSDKRTLKTSAIPLSQAAEGLDVQKAKLGIGVNDAGEKFLVWKLSSMDKVEDSDTVSVTIYVIDAKTGNRVTTIEKEFDHSMKYQRHGDDKWSKMQGHYGDLSSEERAEKMSQYKEIREAFDALSQEDRDAVKSHFRDMKGQFHGLTDEQRAEKHAEFKQQMETFAELTLQEKISYLEYLAISLRNQA